MSNVNDHEAATVEKYARRIREGIYTGMAVIAIGDVEHNNSHFIFHDVGQAKRLLSRIHRAAKTLQEYIRDEEEEEEESAMEVEMGAEDE